MRKGRTKGKRTLYMIFFGQDHDFIATQRIGRTNVGYDTIRHDDSIAETDQRFRFSHLFQGLFVRIFLYVIHVTKKKKQKGKDKERRGKLATNHRNNFIRYIVSSSGISTQGSFLRYIYFASSFNSTFPLPISFRNVEKRCLM